MSGAVLLSGFLVLFFSLSVSFLVLIMAAALKKYEKSHIEDLGWVGFNQHIKESLDDYLINKNVDYSLLISGAWGVGKTRFIKNYIRDKENSLYVSCYGIKNKNEFSIQIMSQIYPMIFNRTNAGLLRVLSKVLGYGFSRDDVTLFSGAILGRKESSGYGILDGKILIIDDIERAEVPVSQIMSYISRMLESFDCHCVMLAEESKIQFLIDDEENPFSKYNDIKEKTVAETFFLVPNGESAIESFIEKNCFALSVKMRRGVKEAAISIYKDSEVKNLRVYRHAVMSLSRLIECLGLTRCDKALVIKDFLRMYIILKVEKFSGVLLKEKIGISDINYTDSYSIDEDSSKKIVAERIFGDYGVRSDGAILDFETWDDVVDKSIRNKKSILTQIGRAIRSRSAAGDPFWYWAWHFFRAGKDDFEDSLYSIFENLKGDNVVNNRDIEQSVGVLLSLSDEGIIERGEGEILELGKDAIRRNILKEGGIHFASDGFSRLTYNGFAYHQKERKNFLEFIDYVDLKISEQLFERKEGMAFKVYSELQHEFAETLKYISGDVGSNDMKWQSPFMSGFDVEDFSSYLAGLEQVHRLAFCDVMEKRIHRLKAHGADINHEVLWLNKVANKLNNNMEDGEELKRYHINVVCEKLNTISLANRAPGPQGKT